MLDYFCANSNFNRLNGSKEQSPKLLIKGIQVDNICKTTTFSKLMRSVVSFKMSPITSKTKIAYDVKGFNSSLNIINKQTSFFENINLLFRGYGSPDKSGGKFFNSIENLHLCTMNNQGLLALAQLILPSEILSNFEVVRVEEEASLIRIYLDESVKAEYKENPEIESKGFCEAVTIRDFPIRDKGVDLIVRRRKWYDKQNNRYFSDSYDLKAEETRYSKEFAAFLKGVYGDDSYDLPFA